MRHIDPHPEDLLDRELKGELRTDERLRLRAHLQTCSACNLEYGARRAFQADLVALGHDASGTYERAPKGSRGLMAAARHQRPTRRATAIAATILLVLLLLLAGWSFARFTAGHPNASPPSPSTTTRRPSRRPRRLLEFRFADASPKSTDEIVAARPSPRRSGDRTLAAVLSSRAADSAGSSSSTVPVAEAFAIRSI